MGLDQTPHVSPKFNEKSASNEAEKMAFRDSQITLLAKGLPDQHRPDYERLLREQAAEREKLGPENGKKAETPILQYNPLGAKSTPVRAKEKTAKEILDDRQKNVQVNFLKKLSINKQLGNTDEGKSKDAPDRENGKDEGKGRAR